MNKSLLKQIDSLRVEQKDLEDRLEKLKSEKIPTVTDSVQASSKDFPYTQYNAKITGYSNIKYKRNRNNRNKYKKLIKINKYKIDKLVNELEYELKKVEDTEIRQIIRYRYEDNMNWVQIAHKMNETRMKKIYTDDSARKKLERFLKNL